jgi:biotin operon repressor
LVLALLTAGDVGVVGRQNLAKMVGVGEGAIRTIIKRLKKDGYMESNASGCRLTSSGMVVYRSIRDKITKHVVLGRSKLTVGDLQVALLVRRSSGRVGTGIEQRDAAIKVGARGATTYVIKGDRFQIPGDSEDCERDFPGPIWKRIRTKLQPLEGDVVIVSGSENEITSTLGAMSAALALLL